jgi:hypothetical protein
MVVDGRQPLNFFLHLQAEEVQPVQRKQLPHFSLLESVEVLLLQTSQIKDILSPLTARLVRLASAIKLYASIPSYLI